MANNDGRKISSLSACNAPEANALLVITGNTALTKNTFSLTISTLFGNNQVDVVVANSKILSANSFILRRNYTPGSSGETVNAGAFWWDSTYLYIAIANNTIRRVTLEAF